MHLPLLASADAVEISGIYYNLTDKIEQAEVTRHPDYYSGSVVIPESVVYKGKNYSVTTIGTVAFSNCQSLTSVTIPSTITSIGQFAFLDCYKLTSVHISDLAAWCTIEFSINDSNPLSFAHRLYVNGEEVKDLVIPNNVTSISKHAFEGCSGLNSVIIPNSVTSIGGMAFSGCSGLESVTIPNSVTSIGYNAFEKCINLSSVTIPNSVTSISSMTFYQCSGLTSVTIPNSVTTIGNNAFNECCSLLFINIPNSVTSIEYSAFVRCSKLTSVTIPNSVSSIGEHAFYGCSGLTSISIGNGVKNIGNNAFANCSNLTDVYCLAENIPTTSQNAFNDSYIEYSTLHVPVSSVNAYKTAEPWKYFKSIVALPETKKCATPSINYRHGQLSFSCDTEGTTFVTNITDSDIKTHYDETIHLTATYNISVYAAKTGFDNSDTVTATLCWIDTEPKTEGITNSVAQVRAQAVMIKSDDGILQINGVDNGTDISVYSISGEVIGSTKVYNEQATVNTYFRKGDIAIIKIGEKTIKVIVQ